MKIAQRFNAGPVPLSSVLAFQSGTAPPRSKTLARHPRFLVPFRAQPRKGAPHTQLPESTVLPPLRNGFLA
jgi:hypothetical protein